MGRWKAFECRVKNPHHPHHLQIPYGEDFSLARRATNIVEVHLRKNRKRSQINRGFVDGIEQLFRLAE